MNLIQATKVIFSQLQSMLATLKDEEYSNSLDLLSHASIGKHVRHIVEFYECLNESVVLGNSLDYDLRNRNEEYEKSPAKVIIALSTALDKLTFYTDLKKQ